MNDADAARINATIAYIRKLEEALKPFAAVAEYEDVDDRFWEDSDGVRHIRERADDDEYWSVFYRDIRARHFRAARDALKEGARCRHDTV
jgi:hypothetical protein